MDDITLSVIAFMVGLVAVICSSIGKILFKYWKDAPSKCKRYAPDAIIVATNLVTVFTTGFLPLTVSSLFSGLPIVLSQLASRWLLKTKMSNAQWVLTVLIMGAVAAIITCTTLDQRKTDSPVEIFHQQITQAIWPLVFFILPVIFIIAGFLHLRQFSEEKLDTSLYLALLGATIGTSFFIIELIMIKVAVLIIYESKVPSKGYYSFYGIIPILAICQLLYVGYMWRTLNVVYVLPLYQSFNIVSGTIGGVVMFREYPGWPVLFVCSILALATMNGAFLFCGNTDPAHDDEKSLEESETHKSVQMIEIQT
jgi:hypothetical protein